MHNFHVIILLTDINECDLEIDNCHINATCNDTIGSFECTCIAGFEGDGVNCTSKAGRNATSVLCRLFTTEVVLKYKLRFLEVFTYTIFTKLLCTNQKSS